MSYLVPCSHVFQSSSALWSPRLEKRVLVCMILAFLFVYFTCVAFCLFSFFSFSVGGWLWSNIFQKTHILITKYPLNFHLNNCPYHIVRYVSRDISDYINVFVSAACPEHIVGYISKDISDCKKTNVFCFRSCKLFFDFLEISRKH